MTDEFAALTCIPLKPGSKYPQPLEPPNFVRLGDPAIDVMTDFTIAHPVTITAEVSIDDALEHMKTSGVRLLLVIDEEASVIGLITAKDILGERPIKVAQESRIAHSEITVGLVMTPQEDVAVLSLVRVNESLVGHIVETLNQHDGQHILVAEEDEETGGQQVRGMFSMSQVSKQLHRDVSHHVEAVHSLAEIVHETR